MIKKMNHFKGFTLIELLVAIAVFSVLAVMAYGGLDTVLDARTSTDEAAQRLSKLQRTFLWIKRDIEHIVIRPVRGEYGETQSAFLSAEYGDYRLELTRAGHRNPAKLPRSELQRVAYGMQDEKLIRYSWNYLDRAQDSKARDVILLDKVSSIRFRFMSDDQQWHESWPPPNVEGDTSALMPIAVEVMLELEDWGRLTRLLLVGANAHG